HAQREAALAIGATHAEMIWLSVLRLSAKGLFGAVVLGLGRALGETMAVTMLIGNRNEIAHSLFSPAQTMASLIANEYPEATNPLHIGALAYIGLILFAISFIVQGVARYIVNRFAKRAGGA
ncbi:ABC transporter permease subunit, partial [bacterium]